jgi:branched-subunit amino acid ABC-type transport system permease component
LKCLFGYPMDKSFKVQVLETTASLITAAFGLVAALAWNETIKALVKAVVGTADDIWGMFIYAMIVTIIAVVATILIAKALSDAKEVDEKIAAKKNDKKKE